MRKHSLLSSVPSSVRIGWSTASHPLVAPNTFSVISAATPTAWRSQSPLGLPRGEPSHLPLERLRAWQPATPDDPDGRGVLAPLPAPRSSPRLRPHSPLRFSGPPTAQVALATLLPFPGPTDRLATRLRIAARG